MLQGVLRLVSSDGAREKSLYRNRPGIRAKVRVPQTSTFHTIQPSSNTWAIFVLPAIYQEHRLNADSDNPDSPTN